MEGRKLRLELKYLLKQNEERIFSFMFLLVQHNIIYICSNILTRYYYHYTYKLKYRVTTYNSKCFLVLLKELGTIIGLLNFGSLAIIFVTNPLCVH